MVSKDLLYPALAIRKAFANGRTAGIEEMANLAHVVALHTPCDGYSKCQQEICKAAVTRVAIAEEAAKVTT